MRMLGSFFHHHLAFSCSDISNPSMAVRQLRAHVPTRLCFLLSLYLNNWVLLYYIAILGLERYKKDLKITRFNIYDKSYYLFKNNKIHKELCAQLSHLFQTMHIVWFPLFFPDCNCRYVLKTFSFTVLGLF